MVSLQEAFARHQSGDLDGAVRLYQEILAASPNNAEAAHLLGVAFFQGEQFADAVRLFSRAVELDGSNPDYLNNLGLAQFNCEAFAEAQQSYVRALTLNPQSVDALNNLGMALQKLDDVPSALDRFEAALVLAPDEPEILHNYGVALQAADQLDKAARTLEKSLNLGGHNPDSYATLGAVRFDMDDADGAFEALWNAIKTDPFHQDAHECFKTLKWRIGQADAMHDTLRWVCEALPKEPAAYLQLGRELVKDHAFAKAVPVLRHVLEIAPDHPHALAYLGRALSELGEHEDAIEAFEKAIAGGIADAEIFENYGQSLINADLHEAAVPILKQAHQLNPRWSLALGMLTIAMTEAGDPEVHEFVDYNTNVTTRMLPTPKGYKDLDAFNAALHQELQTRHSKDFAEPINQTMRGGTQIPGDVFSNPSGAVLAAKTAITKAIRDYILSLTPDADHPFLRYINPNFRYTGVWSTILHGAGYDGAHIHDEGWLSGVYYVKVPDLPDDRWAAGEGCIQFGAPPAIYVTEKNQTKRLVKPEPGMLVLFPSYIWHGVQPFTMEGERHAIAFDMI